MDQGIEAGTAVDAAGAGEAAEGITLAAWIAEAAELGFRPPGCFRDVARIMTSLCEALGAGHAAGGLHGHLRPSRIRLDAEGRIAVAANGTSPAEDARSLALAGKLDAPASWLAPEQIVSPSPGVDVRTDLFALGAILYEMLTFKRPFDGADDLSTLKAIAGGAPAPPRSISAAVPRDLAAISMKALARDPAGRYQTVAEFDHDLRRYLSGDVLLAESFETEPVAADEPDVEPDEEETVTTAPEEPRAPLPPPPPAPKPATVAVMPDSPPVQGIPLVVGILAAVVLIALGAFGWFLYSSETGLSTDLEKSLREERLLRSEADVALRNAKEDRTELESRLEAALRKEDAWELARTALERERDAALGAGAEAKRSGLEAREAQAGAERAAEAAKEFNAILAAVLSAVMASPLDEKEPLYALKDAAKMTRRTFADDPAAQVSLRVPIGRAYARLGHHALAQLHFREALKLLETVSGSTHPDTLKVRRYLAGVLVDEGKLADAESLLRRNLEQSKAAFGDRHPSTILAARSLADVLTAKGHFEDAETLCTGALEAAREIFGADHLTTLRTMRQLAAILIGKGDRPAAETLQREALNGLRRTCGREHPGTLETVNALALNLIGLEKYESAETQLLTAYSVLKKFRGERVSERESAVNLLIRLYDAWGKPEKASRWRETLGVLKGG